jgi:hypothetical protein
MDAAAAACWSPSLLLLYLSVSVSSLLCFFLSAAPSSRLSSECKLLSITRSKGRHTHTWAPYWTTRRFSFFQSAVFFPPFKEREALSSQWHHQQRLYVCWMVSAGNHCNECRMHQPFFRTCSGGFLWVPIHRIALCQRWYPPGITLPNPCILNMYQIPGNFVCLCQSKNQCFVCKWFGLTLYVSVEPIMKFICTLCKCLILIRFV